MGNDLLNPSSATPIKPKKWRTKNLYTTLQWLLQKCYEHLQDIFQNILTLLAWEKLLTQIFLRKLLRINQLNSSFAKDSIKNEWFKMSSAKTLTLPVAIPDEKKKKNLNFYFHTPLWCLERFYEALKGREGSIMNFTFLRNWPLKIPATLRMRFKIKWTK